jgi:hypothetical protein
VRCLEMLVWSRWLQRRAFVAAPTLVSAPKADLSPSIGTTIMKAITLVGILLVIAGALALAYGRISYTRQEQIFEIGPIHATKETHKQIPLPPVLGGSALVGGVALLAIGARRKG